MRTLLATVLIAFLGAAGPAPAWTQPAEEEAVVRRVRLSILEGDARALLSPATDRLEVSLFGAQSFYSSAQAQYVLRDFFKNYPPQRFEVVEVARSGGSQMVSGRYWHARTDQPLHMYVYLILRGGAWQLEGVRVN